MECALFNTLSVIPSKSKHLPWCRSLHRAVFFFKKKKKIKKNLDIHLAWRIMEPVRETKGKDKTPKRPNQHRYRHARRNTGSSYSECFNQCSNQMCGSAGEEINLSASTPTCCIEHLHERSFTVTPSSNWSF